MEAVQRIAGSGPIPVNQSDPFETVVHAERTPLPAPLPSEFLAPEHPHPSSRVFRADSRRKLFSSPYSLHENVDTDHEKSFSLLGGIHWNELKGVDQAGIELLLLDRAQSAE